jgi:glycerophosphoryl diester phosphodiesterase
MPRFCCEERKLKLPVPFRIIAHRGASGYAPENTMAAFRRAVEMGCSDVETDVYFTKDGKLLLFHDDTLDRTTDGSGLPEDYTLDELKQLDAGSWWSPENPGDGPQLFWDRDYAGERLITLEELLDEFGSSLTYHIELKKESPGLVPAVIEAVRRRGLVENVFIASIDADDSLQETMRIEPAIRVASAPNTRIKKFGARAIEQNAEFGYAMTTLSAWNHSRELVQLGQSLGMEVRSSGIANRQIMVDAVATGCNGMTINWPDWLMDYVAGVK